MRRATMVAGLVLGLGAAAGCGGSGGGTDLEPGTGQAGSCVVAGGQICHEHRGIDTFQVQQLQSSCTSLGGTFSSGSCPELNRSGRCAATAGAQSVIYAYYNVTGEALQLLKTSCADSGSSWLDN